MPAELLDEEKIEKNPDFQLSQWLFLLKTDESKTDVKTKSSLMEAIQTNGNL